MSGAKGTKTKQRARRAAGAGNQYVTISLADLEKIAGGAPQWLSTLWHKVSGNTTQQRQNKVDNAYVAKLNTPVNVQAGPNTHVQPTVTGNNAKLRRKWGRTPNV